MPQLDRTAMKALAQKAMTGKATAEELDALLDALRGEGKEPSAMQVILDDLLGIDENPDGSDDFLTDTFREAPEKYADILENVLQSDKLPVSPAAAQGPSKTTKRSSLYWYRAAVILCVCAIGTLIALSIQKNRKSVIQSVRQVDHNKILPGKDKAILTLADGRKIILDSAGNGVLADQNGVDVHKVQNGQLIYTENQPKELAATSAKVAYNTIVTPRGGKYQLVLPDGTKVWLNADSRLHFPTRFSGEQRIVSMEGEAYFEVAKDARHPFIVQTSRDMRVRVLGTHFNVMDYRDQPAIKTTLLEGAVRVTHQQDSLLIQPGQQVVLAKDGALSKRNNIDLDRVVAWKNGLFYFDQMPIAAIMQALGRWYDVEVVYEGPAPGDLFSAIMNRDNDIHEILSMLEATEKVHFEISGRTIKVLAAKRS